MLGQVIHLSLPMDFPLMTARLWPVGSALLLCLPILIASQPAVAGLKSLGGLLSINLSAQAAPPDPRMDSLLWRLRGVRFYAQALALPDKLVRTTTWWGPETGAPGCAEVGQPQDFAANLRGALGRHTSVLSINEVAKGVFEAEVAIEGPTREVVILSNVRAHCEVYQEDAGNRPMPFSSRH